ncbi:MAG: hypothetical protein NTW72_01195, partial [Gemmatimonadetes bacterium]|nr:hypothetical protein [Gemmatimonadota bacterium]
MQDSYGNTVTTSSATLVLALNSMSVNSNEGIGIAALSCNGLQQSAVNGVVTFIGCRIRKADPAYKIAVTGTNLAGKDTSAAFAVEPAPASSLQFARGVYGVAAFGGTGGAP